MLAACPAQINTPADCEKPHFGPPQPALPSGFDHQPISSASFACEVKSPRRAFSSSSDCLGGPAPELYPKLTSPTQPPMFLAMSPPASRKRPAPGASPLPAAPGHPIPQSYANHDHVMRYNGVAANANNFPDLSNQFMALPQQQQPQQPQQQQQQQPQQSQPAPLPNVYPSQTQPQSQSPTSSNVLALRDNAGASRALVPTAQRSGYDAQNDQWATNQTRDLVPASGAARVQDEEEILRQLVAKAKRIEEEATKDNPGSNQKRSIPPFVLKLSRYVCLLPTRVVVDHTGAC